MELTKVERLIRLVRRNLPHLHSGKVRESFQLPSVGNTRMRLVIVTDRRSIFDFKLGFVVPGVGMVLNATNIYYRSLLDNAGIKHDLIASGVAIDEHLKSSPKLCGIPELWKRAIVVRELEMIPVECIARNYLTGSGWEQYEEHNGIVCGHQLPPGLLNGSKLPEFICTPSTKALVGHDMPIPIQDFRVDYPAYLEEKTLEVMGLVRDDVQHLGTFICADGKAEGGIDPESGEFRWGDEIGTPDACRVWNTAEYREAWPAKLPSPYDKELIRNWGRELGVHKLDPKSPKDQRYVRALRPSEDQIYPMGLRYLNYFFRTKHMTLVEYQNERMGIPREMCG